MKTAKQSLLSLVFSIFLIFPIKAEVILAESPQSPVLSSSKKVLFLGNSFTYYNNNLATHVRDITKALPDKNEGIESYAFRSVTISSARLGWHIDNFKFQNTLQKWDTVIFQGQSTEPISAKMEVKEYFEKSAVEMAEIAHQAGQKVIYFMTWGYSEKGNLQETKEMTEKLLHAYNSIAQKTQGYVAPVGLAFYTLQQEYPEINLYSIDKKHPSIEGTYLAACVIFSTLYDVSPIGAPPPNDFILSPKKTKILQEIAWKTVQEYRKK